MAHRKTQGAPDRHAAWAGAGRLRNPGEGFVEPDFRKAWRELETIAAAAGDGRARRLRKGQTEARDIPPEMKSSLRRLKQADDEAYKARMDAEAQFDEADKPLEHRYGREGTQMAIDAWILREKLIRKMETFRRP